MDASNTIFLARRARWAVAGVFLANGFMVGSWAPHIPLVMGRLRISESTMGMLIFCFGIGALLSMPWCGWLMARFGERAVLRTFGLIQGGGLLLVVLAPDVWTTAVAMIAFGAMIGCTDVAMNAATVSVERRTGKAVMSSMHGFWSLGGFAGSAFGGFLLQGTGAAVHAAIVGAAVVGAGILCAPHFLKIAGEAKPAGTPPEPFRLPKSPIVYLLGVVALFVFVSEGAVLDWGALYMGQERGAGIAVAGLAYAFFAGAMAVMRFAGDIVRDRYGAVRTMRVSSFIASAAMLAAALLPTPTLVILAFFIAGLGVANTVPIAFSAAGNQPGISVGAGMSVVTTMGYAGILLAPSSIGFIGEHTGFGPVFAAMAALLFITFLMAPMVSAADAKPTSSH